MTMVLETPTTVRINVPRSEYTLRELISTSLSNPHEIANYPSKDPDNGLSIDIRCYVCNSPLNEDMESECNHRGVGVKLQVSKWLMDTPVLEIPNAVKNLSEWEQLALLSLIYLATFADKEGLTGSSTCLDITMSLELLEKLGYPILH